MDAVKIDILYKWLEEKDTDYLNRFKENKLIFIWKWNIVHLWFIHIETSS